MRSLTDGGGGFHIFCIVMRSFTLVDTLAVVNLDSCALFVHPGFDAAPLCPGRGREGVIFFFPLTLAPGDKCTLHLAHLKVGILSLCTGLWGGDSC